MTATSPQSLGERLLPLGLAVAGLTARLWLAYSTFLNPDEAWHYFLSAQSSLAEAYRESLTTAHPPLMILVLWAWHYLGHSELWLRLPSVIAGTAFCWVMFLWMKDAAGRTAAMLNLVLLLFLPSLVTLSAEVRQYSLLLFFCACALYCLERAFAEDSALLMLASTASLMMALLTHYSSLIFAATLGVYGLLQLRRASRRLAATWLGGQVASLALVAWLLLHHVAELRAKGLSNEMAANYARAALFHPGEESVLTFILKNSARLFRYFFMNGTIGVIALLIFLFSVGYLLLGKTRSQHARSPALHLGILLLFPFLVTLLVGLAQLYPYGGIRHDIILAPFAVAGISTALARLKSPAMAALIVAIPLAVGSFHPTPTGPYISPKNQSRDLMRHSVEALGSLPSGAEIVTDYEGGLLLSYYLCGHPVVDLDTSAHDVRAWPCGTRQVITPGENIFVFTPQSFSELRPFLAQSPPPNLWLFQAGWIGDKSDLRPGQPKLGCRNPQTFGQNIFLCQIPLPSAAGQP